MMNIITARTKQKRYPVYVDIKFDVFFPVLIKKRFQDSEKIILVTNNKIFAIYEDKIKSTLEECLLPYEIIIIKDGEEYKNLESADYIYSRLIDFNVHRNDVIVAFGGGVIGDLAGFAASTFNRGMKLIHCPTTIISQVDSCMGGKVGVNYKKIKNIIGSFYQPDAVIIDPTFNYTLDEDQIINGLGEFDMGYRNLLNFGHTVGHCIENAFDLKEINHGKAISIGMLIAIDISISLGLLKEEFKKRIIELYKKLKLPYIIPEIDIEKIIDAIKYDKKFKTAQNKFVLLKGMNKPLFYYNLEKSIIIDNIKKS